MQARRAIGVLTGLTRLFQDATNTVSTRNLLEGGWCFHCDGTGLARPRWARSGCSG
ncbi:hypothetical protein ACQSMD_31740 [Streptomyces flavovirens]|uniref:hypothetical protein n=1 Tax=Streptomyces flavovirens TaxID=52258 RepID=UPI003D0F9F11